MYLGTNLQYLMLRGMKGFLFNCILTLSSQRNCSKTILVTNLLNKKFLKIAFIHHDFSALALKKEKEIMLIILDLCLHRLSQTECEH